MPTKEKRPRAEKNGVKKVLARNELIIAIFAITLMAIISTQFLIFTANTVMAQTPVLGLRFNDTLVGLPSIPGTKDQSIQLVLEKIKKEPITLKVGSTTKDVSVADLGITFDDTASSKKILQSGRTGNIIDRVIYQDLALIGQKNETLIVANVDESLARNFFKKIAETTNQAKKNASFGIQNGKVVVLGDQSGITLEYDQAIADMKHYFTAYHPSLSLPIKTEKADITSSDISPLLPQVENAVKDPLEITANNQNLNLGPEQLNSVIVIQKSLSTNKYDIGFNESGVSALLTSLASKVNIAPQAEVTDGIDTLSPGWDGQQIDQNQAVKTIIDGLNQRRGGPGKGPVKLTLNVNPVKKGKIFQKPKLVTLTFDDGPGQATNQILDELKAAGAHATFFLIGHNVVSDPATAKRIAAEGNTIGNHTFNHVDLRALTTEQIKSEMSQANDAILAATGVTPKVFRAPYSFYSQGVRDAAASLGMQIMSYTVDPGDWQNPGVKTIQNKVLNRVVPGSIVIMHVDQQTADALPAILQGLKAKGYRLR